jgi:hypothetical protein
MDDNLVRVESAVTATASGDLSWDRWTLDCAVALGWAGKRNPLGFAVVRYLSGEPSSATVWAVVVHLASALVNAGHDAALATDAAWQALDVWNNRRCPKCGGRGVVSIEQETCGACNGTGQRSIDALPDPVKAGLSALISAESWMEGQLRASMRRGV